MNRKPRLAKSRDSRTRAQEKTQVTDHEIQILSKDYHGDKAAFVEYLLGKGYSSNTIKRYLFDVTNFEVWAEKQNVLTESIGYADLLHFIQNKKTEITQRTISTKINSLKHYFNFLSLSGNCLNIPTAQISIKGIKRKKLYHILKKQELENLYQAYTPKIISTEKTVDTANQNQNWYKKSELSQQRNKVIIGLLIYQGLNALELARLTKNDLKLREGKIYIAGTRRSNERELTLEAVQIFDLMEYTMKVRESLNQLTGKETEQLIISTGNSEKLTNTLKRLVDQLIKINSNVSSLKQIRTSVITHWLKIYNLRQVQHMAGHRFVSSTEAYLINDLDDLQEDIVKFHPIG